ncbi:MAG: HD domain-containing phosphohydrolase [Syntrophobacter sp.]
MHNTEKPKQMRLVPVYVNPAEVMSDFIPIRIRSLFPGSILPCDFFFPSITEREELEPERVLNRGAPYVEDTHLTFLREEIDFVYINPRDEDVFLAYFNSQTQSAIKSPDVPNVRKTQLLYDNAESLVKKIFRERPNESNILISKRLVEDFGYHLSSERITATALLSLFSKDYYTFNHCIQVAMLGMSFCIFLGWSNSEVKDFGLGTLLHDVGKSLISEEILNKPQRLESEEFEIVKQHSRLGYEQLEKTNVLSRDQLETVLFHHEAMDGSGYPHGLVGDSIPRYARVAHIVDVFDALTAERVYKKALSRPEALMLMKSEMRSTFDEEFLSAFCRFIEGSSLPCGPSANTINAGIGTRFSLQCQASGEKTQSTMVGIKEGECIILAPSDSIGFWNLKAGMSLIVRYIFGGAAYGFKTYITEILHHPSHLLFVAYPKRIERHALRCERRIECSLPAIMETGGERTRCIVLDLSYKGCRVAIKSPAADRAHGPVEENIAISIQLPGANEAACLRGTIRNIDTTEEGQIIGIQFSKLSAQAAERWRIYIAETLELMS